MVLRPKVMEYEFSSLKTVQTDPRSLSATQLSHLLAFSKSNVGHCSNHCFLQDSVMVNKRTVHRDESHQIKDVIRQTTEDGKPSLRNPNQLLGAICSDRCTGCSGIFVLFHELFPKSLPQNVTPFAPNKSSRWRFLIQRLPSDQTLS